MFRCVWSVRPSELESNEGRVLDKSAAARGMSNSCPIPVPGASVAVFWLLPESRKYFILLRRHRFESYSAHHSWALLCAAIRARSRGS